MVQFVMRAIENVQWLPLYKVLMIVDPCPKGVHLPMVE
jgi:hypothetical protein